MKKLTLILTLLAYIAMLTAAAAPQTALPTLLPFPKETLMKTGNLALPAKLCLTGNSDSLQNEISLAKQFWAEDFNIVLCTDCKKLSVGLELNLAPDFLPDHPDAYRIDVLQKKIEITGNTPAAVFYALQSLRQLVQKSKKSHFIPRLTITDYPQYAWRAFMLDEARHFKGKEVVMQLLDNMARLKMNVFHWHLTDDVGWRIEIKKYPLLTETGAFRDSTLAVWGGKTFNTQPHSGYYTQQQIKEVIEYAAARHISIVPEIEMPGHASAAIAAYPWLGARAKQIRVPCAFENLDLLNVADPSVFDFLTDVLHEVAELFPGKIIHIGGDEVEYEAWNENPEIQEFMRNNAIASPNDLQLQFTNRIEHYLAENGRTMMGWNEITGIKIDNYWLPRSEDDTRLTRQLSKNAIVHCWAGDEKLFKKIAQSGYRIVNSSVSYTYLDSSYQYIPIEKSYSFNPMPDGLSQQEQQRVLGTGCQMWCEYVPTVAVLHRLVFPRIAAYAESGWTANGQKDYARFQRSLDYFLAVWKKQGINCGKG